MPTTKPTAPALLSQIIALIKANDASAINALIADPATPASVWRGRNITQWGEEPLMRHALEGKIDALKALLAVCDPNQVSGFGETPLMSAAQAQDAQAVRLLLPATNPNIQNKTGQAALSLVIEALAFWGDHGGDFTALLDCAKALAPVSDLAQRDRMGMDALGLLRSHAKTTERPEGLWACADIIAPFCERQEALAAFSEAPAGSMPGFSALLEREALSGVIQQRTSDTDAPASASRSASSNRI